MRAPTSGHRSFGLWPLHVHSGVRSPLQIHLQITPSFTSFTLLHLAFKSPFFHVQPCHHFFIHSSPLSPRSLTGVPDPPTALTLTCAHHPGIHLQVHILISCSYHFHHRLGRLHLFLTLVHLGSTSSFTSSGHLLEPDHLPCHHHHRSSPNLIAWPGFIVHLVVHPDHLWILFLDPVSDLALARRRRAIGAADIRQRTPHIVAYACHRHHLTPSDRTCTVPVQGPGQTHPGRRAGSGPGWSGQPTRPPARPALPRPSSSSSSPRLAAAYLRLGWAFAFGPWPRRDRRSGPARTSGQVKPDQAVS